MTTLYSLTRNYSAVKISFYVRELPACVEYICVFLTFKQKEIVFNHFYCNLWKSNNNQQFFYRWELFKILFKLLIIMSIYDHVMFCYYKNGSYCWKKRPISDRTTWIQVGESYFKYCKKSFFSFNIIKKWDD